MIHMIHIQAGCGHVSDIAFANTSMVDVDDDIILHVD